MKHFGNNQVPGQGLTIENSGEVLVDDKKPKIIKPKKVWKVKRKMYEFA